jgi:DNA-binding NtrC family response regulator/pSer/pThr/pTyr-binding forkhead associated (FHA) protein
MAELVFSKGAEVILRAPLNVRSFRVGRSPLNDLMLPDEGMAPFHLSVERTSEGYVVHDRTGQGTLVNGRPVSEAALRNNDRITLGALTATFELGEGPVRTAVLPQNDAPAGPAQLVLPDGRRIPVTRDGLRVGSDAGNDVVLTDGFVSSFHALVFTRDGRVLVRDLGSTNGTQVNGIKVTEAEVPWDSAITFGRVVGRVVGTDTSHAKVREQTLGDLVYADPAMDTVARNIRNVANHDPAVFILGESGCGKELVARAIHQVSGRAQEPYVAVNCAALAPSLLESELFGHEKGAFTGADKLRMGAFEQAGKGTLFLDEIADLPMDAQSKLLRALENREIRRVGGERTVRVTCRVLCATHQSLANKVAVGTFRGDLFHRLSVLPLKIPALRERKADIPVLARHFLRSIGDGTATLSPTAMEKLLGHSWPGNVRELRNVLTQAVVMGGRKLLGADDLNFTPLGLQDQLDAARIYSPGKTLADIELEVMEQAVELHGSHAAAARELGIARSTLVARLSAKRKK